MHSTETYMIINLFSSVIIIYLYDLWRKYFTFRKIEYLNNFYSVNICCSWNIFKFQLINYIIVIFFYVCLKRIHIDNTHNYNCGVIYWHVLICESIWLIFTFLLISSEEVIKTLKFIFLILNSDWLVLTILKLCTMSLFIKLNQLSVLMNLF